MNVKLNEVPVQHVAAKVVFQGERITLPQGMEIPIAIQTLVSFQEQQEKGVSFSESFGVFPWDGAHALKKVLEARFGFVDFQGGETSVEVAPGVKESVPWGSFKLPKLATFHCDASKEDGRWTFNVSAETKRKSEGIVRTVFKDLRDFLAGGGSIYQGKAIKLRLEDENGRTLGIPEPKFIDTAKIDTSALLFNEDVAEQLEVNLYTPIRRVGDLKTSGIPIKRAVLLSGTFGTGKTMAASAAAKMAVAEGVTYLYIKRASELAGAIEFVKPYSNPACVIFCEDIDRAVGGERDTKMDDLLNIVDGLESKHANVIIVLTTNDVQAIHPAMLRPGRLDAVIHVSPPNARTAEAILRKYCGELLPAHESIEHAAGILSGQIPAVLSEVVKRAKLAQLAIQPKGTPTGRLTGEALRLAALGIMGQVKLLEQRIAQNGPTEPTVSEFISQQIVHALRNGGGEMLQQVVQDAMN